MYGRRTALQLADWSYGYYSIVVSGEVISDEEKITRRT